VQTRLAGFAQSKAGQSDCYSCDNIENSYQEDANATACTPCALGTQRYTGVLNATTKRACQCKPGNTHLPRTIALGRRCSSFELPLLPSRRLIVLTMLNSLNVLFNQQGSSVLLESRAR
jgi:hypothetical protein